MKKFKIKNFITESSLTVSEINKYGWRGELFLKKLKEQQPFELINGSEVILKYPNKELENIIITGKSPRNYKIPLSDGNEISFKDLKKTKEFGGGSGSGGGAKQTAIAESAQCVYCQCIWTNPKTDFNEQELSTAYNKVHVDSSLEDILNMDEEWVNSSVTVAKFLHSVLGKRNYTWYRGTGVQSEMAERYKKLNPKEEVPFQDLNKWTPADIWMVATDAKSYDFDGAESIQYLNNELIKAYQARDYIGISLKKVKGTKVKISQVNYRKPFKEPVYRSKTLGKKDYWNAKDGYLFYNGGEIQFRTFPTFQCEIIGKVAKHGKVSGGNGPSSMLGMLMYKVGATPLETQKPLIQLYRKDNKRFMDQWYALYMSSGEKSLERGEFEELAKSKDENWCISKYLVTQVFNNISRKEQQFIIELLRYAKSESKNSAVHLKIY